MRPTTALRKIGAMKKRIRVVQGGQGAAKTYSILTFLINHGSSVPNREIIVCSAQLTKMRLTVIKDFVKIMKDFGIFEENRFIAETLYRFPNNSFIKFIGLDKDDIGKGLRSHVCYFNEVNKITFEAYRELSSRAKVVYADFNPNARFFIHEQVITRKDCDFLKLTFMDNEFLDIDERNEILLYQEMGYNPDGTIKNAYWANKWRVYGLGEIGTIEGSVWSDWSIIKGIPDEAELLGFGCDFGYRNSKTAITGVHWWNNRYIFDEWIHDIGLFNRDIADIMYGEGYDGAIMYCDYADQKSKDELRGHGINAEDCASKVDIREYAINKVASDHFYVTERSKGLINDLEQYVFLQDKNGKKLNKPKKEFDDGPDSIIYFVGTQDKYDGTY